MTFKQKYTENDFLAVLSPENPRSIASIEKDVGCTKNTAKVYLRKLEDAGLIRRIEIEGSNYGYVKNVADFESTIFRDKEHMSIISDDIFQDILSYYVEYGGDPEITLKFFLAILTGGGYQLTADLIMLTANKVCAKKNEITFECSYPINCGFDVNSEGNFTVSIIPQVIEDDKNKVTRSE